MAELYFLVCVDARLDEAALQSPHVTPSKILIFESKLKRIQSNTLGVNRVNTNTGVDLQLEHADD